MWLLVLEKNPIWFFDATGGIINKINGQPKPLLYSIVFHDKDKKLINPIAEFVTTANDSKSISSYLEVIKLELLKKIPKTATYRLPPLVVTDFSWGLINSVMETFNCCTTDIYINWCFEVLFYQNACSIPIVNAMKTIFILCAFHFLKLIIKKVRKIKPHGEPENDKKIQNAFIFVLTLLQNATTVDDFSKNLKHAFNIFNLKYISSKVSNSKSDVQNQLLSRNMTSITFDDPKKEDNYKKYRSNQNIMILDDDFNESSLKKNSPFKIYYENLIKKHSQNVKLKLKLKDKLEENFYYCPQMFGILLEYTYILPFWTGLMLNYWKTLNPKYKSIISSRLDNNNVENWFRQVNLMFPNIPVMPSVYSSRMKARTDADCIEKYKKEIDNVVLNTAKHNSDAKETWRDTSKKDKRKSTGYYGRPGKTIFSAKLSSKLT